MQTQSKLQHPRNIWPQLFSETKELEFFKTEFDEQANNPFQRGSFAFDLWNDAHRLQLDGGWKEQGRCGGNPAGRPRESKKFYPTFMNAENLLAGSYRHKVYQFLVKEFDSSKQPVSIESIEIFVQSFASVDKARSILQKLVQNNQVKVVKDDN